MPTHVLGEPPRLRHHRGRIGHQVAPPAVELDSSTFSREVLAGITATKGRPSMRAKYASLTAVEPEDASTIVVSGPIQPLHSP